MKYSWLIAMLLAVTTASAQQQKYTSLAVFTTQNAMPFGKFRGLFAETFHPGIEAGYGKLFSVRRKHSWSAELKFAYFYHRFVQHGIPLYLNLGYRYRINKRFSAESSLGGGYMHSVPVTAKLKLNQDGDYVNNKGIGRMQAIVAYALGVSYTTGTVKQRPLSFFINYQQRVQLPFVKSYVPLLPYNSFFIGLRRPLHNKKK